MGRILRIGVDTVTNYTLLATSAYDAGNPAATTSPWPNSAAMDQPFTQASPTEVSAQGALVTFSRFPDSYSGAQVKLHPTYDVSTSENPFFEMWVHDSVTLTWTLRGSIQLSNPFVGIASGARKVLDFTFFPFLRHIDKVWLTMNPGLIGAPTLKFDAIQLFGQCEGALRKGGGPGGPIFTCDPTKQNLKSTPIVIYTGFKEVYSSTPPFKALVPCDDFASDPGCAFPDLCNPQSVAIYRECLRAIGDGGTSLNNFDGWFTLNNALITSNCAGVTDTQLPDPPATKVPKLPPVDFCDQTSIDAHRALIAGDADLLANFNNLIDALTEAGFFTLVCPPDDPPATYVDPMTLQPAADPPDQPVRPFGAGPGGDPPPNPPGQGNPQTPPGPTTTSVTRAFLISPTKVETDAQAWAAMSTATGALYPLSVALMHRAGTEHWIINRDTGSNLTRTFRIRYNGFLTNATVTVNSAWGNGGLDGFFPVLVVPVYTTPPSYFEVVRNSPPGSVVATIAKLQWSNQTTGTDFTLVSSSDGSLGPVDSMIVIEVVITSDTPISNLRVELL